MLTEQNLLDKKKEIEKVKNNLAELKGEEKSLVKRLKDDWECKDLKEAKKKIETFQTNVKELQTTIETSTEELEDKYFNEEEED